MRLTGKGCLIQRMSDMVDYFFNLQTVQSQLCIINLQSQQPLPRVKIFIKTFHKWKIFLLPFLLLLLLSSLLSTIKSRPSIFYLYNDRKFFLVKFKMNRVDDKQKLRFSISSQQLFSITAMNNQRR